MKVTLEEIKSRVANLDKYVKAELTSIIALITALEGPQKPSPQRTLDGGTADPVKLDPPQIARGELFLQTRNSGPRGHYMKHKEIADDGICDVAEDLIRKLYEEHKEVPLDYAAKQLDTTYNNCRFAAKRILRDDSEIWYVRYNQWKLLPYRISPTGITRRSFLGIMPASRARILGLKNLDAQIEKNTEEATTCQQN